MRSSALILAAVLALTLVACDRLPGKPRYEDRPRRPTEIEDFDDLYNSNCQGCHGSNGTLGAARNLNDPVFLALISDDDMRDVITHGRAGVSMPGFGAKSGGYLTEKQIDILVKEVRARWGDESVVAGTTLPAYKAEGRDGDAARGQSAFATFCGECHGKQGTGGDKGGSVVDGAYLALVSDQALRTAVICGRTDLGMPDWRGLVEGKVMTARQIDDVVAFLKAQRVPYPGQPYPEGR
jgi:cytochrome c oxidase cbb3-type subunit 3/ubiquinol-cytochrome c reductase cytochrome c subunit